jgi:polyhydroxybutyrate depolymerase
MIDLRNTTAAATTALLVCAFAVASAAARDEAPEDRRQRLSHGGVERSFVVRAPDSQARRLPLVLVLHGGGGNAANAERMTGFTELARTRGFIVAYPEGSSRLKDRLLTWNAGHCCGYAMKRKVDDVGFIDALIEKLSAAYPIDPARIYVTGMSNGGMMAHRLGRELPHRFAAIAPVVATLFGDEAQPDQPVSALMINGMLDRSVPWQGGAPGGRAADAWDGTPAKPALAQGEFWARANGCTGDPERADRSKLRIWRYRCPAGKAVELYLLEDTGHAWPGGRRGTPRADDPGASLDASALIWEFFRTHPK